MLNRKRVKRDPYYVLPNHWHMEVRPEWGGEASRLSQCVKSVAKDFARHEKTFLIPIILYHRHKPTQMTPAFMSVLQL